MPELNLQEFKTLQEKHRETQESRKELLS